MKQENLIIILLSVFVIVLLVFLVVPVPDSEVKGICKDYCEDRGTRLKQYNVTGNNDRYVCLCENGYKLDEWIID